MAMTMSRDKTNERNFEAQIWVKLAKNGAETWLFATFSSVDHYFPLKLHTVISCNDV